MIPTPRHVRIAAVLAVAAGAGLALAEPASAQRLGTVRWRGSVERDAIIEVHGERAERRGESVRGDRVEADRPLPSGPCTVYVRTLRGRSLVSVDEQPDADNRWTASVVVVNDRREPDEVEFELLWLRDRDDDDRDDREHGGGGTHRGGSGHGYGDEGTRVDAPPPPPPPVPVVAGIEDPRERPALGPSGRRVDAIAWRGVVDGADVIEFHLGDVQVRHLANLPIQGMTYDHTSPLPEQDVDLVLVKIEGRGKVRLIQQPAPANSWTAAVRIDDTDQGGRDTYQFELRWERPRNLRIGSGGRPLETLTWSGYVDGKVVVSAKGGAARIENLGGREPRGVRASFSAPLPSRPVIVNVDKREGRGKVTILEQPSAANGYTLRAEIDDSKGGDDEYEVVFSWER